MKKFDVFITITDEETGTLNTCSYRFEDSSLINLTNKLVKALDEAENKSFTILSDLSVGDKFKFKGFDWIVLDNNVYGGVLAIMASAWNEKEYCFNENGNNNYAKSSLRIKILNELLPILGEDNLIPHEIDLVADNGDDRYGKITDKLFILSCDEYRKYRKNVPLLPEWMWTCTPWHIPNTERGYGVRIVDSRGGLNSGTVVNGNGVAPACVFKKDLLVDSCVGG